MLGLDQKIWLEAKVNCCIKYLKTDLLWVGPFFLWLIFQGCKVLQLHAIEMPLRTFVVPDF